MVNTEWHTEHGRKSDLVKETSILGYNLVPHPIAKEFLSVEVAPVITFD
jgi:hypothetical protein